jgi:hypothetical protein
MRRKKMTNDSMNAFLILDNQGNIVSTLGGEFYFEELDLVGAIIFIGQEGKVATEGVIACILEDDIGVTDPAMLDVIKEADVPHEEGVG